MKFVFRVDASTQIGTGHLMRCLPIMEEFIQREKECIVYGDVGGITWINKKLLSLEIPVVCSTESLGALQNKGSVLVLDSYVISPNNPVIQKHNWTKVFLIADTFTPNYKVDHIFHLGLDGSWYHGSPEIFTYGPNYIPLRRTLKKRASALSTQPLEKIVIFGGGIDQYNISVHIARSLMNIPNYDVAVFVSKETKEIEMLDSRFKVIDFGDELDLHLNSADLAITTASTSCLEVLAMEIPLAVLCTVPNQIHYYNFLSMNGLATPIGALKSDFTWDINTGNLQKLFADKEYRASQNAKSHGLIDNLGAKRVVDKIIKMSS